MFNSPFRIFSSSAFTVIFCTLRVIFTSGFSAHTMQFGLGGFNWHGTRIFFLGFGFRAYAQKVLTYIFSFRILKRLSLTR